MNPQEQKTSPWGMVKRVCQLLPDVFEVHTDTHWGILIPSSAAQELLSPEARSCAFSFEGYDCFEGHCDSPVVIRELMDRGLFIPPVCRDFPPREYEKAINQCLQIYHPGYWKRTASTRKNKERSNAEWKPI